MKETLKIDLFFIQLICLPLYKKSCRFIQKLVCFSSTWFVSPFQIIMQSRIPLIEKLVCFLSNWFAYSLTIIMQSIYQHLLKNWFVFHPTSLFVHFQLSSRVAQQLFISWFFFHLTSLFAHFQLSHISYIKVGLFFSKNEGCIENQFVFHPTHLFAP